MLLGLLLVLILVVHVLLHLLLQRLGSLLLLFQLALQILSPLDVLLQPLLSVPLQQRVLLDIRQRPRDPIGLVEMIELEVLVEGAVESQQEGSLE